MNVIEIVMLIVVEVVVSALLCALAAIPADAVHKHVLCTSRPGLRDVSIQFAEHPDVAWPDIGPTGY